MNDTRDDGVWIHVKYLTDRSSSIAVVGVADVDGLTRNMRQEELHAELERFMDRHPGAPVWLDNNRDAKAFQKHLEHCGIVARIRAG